MRVICIGNRFAYPDNFGILIYEKLKKMNLNNIEIIEGGVGGLSLMPYFETDKKILIIDFAQNTPKLLTKKDIEKIEIKEYAHSNAFLYLLKTVEKDFLIYTCSEYFKENELEFYIKDILKVINEYNEKNVG